MGGHFAAELKYAGFDGIIIEGKADSPVWLRIVDGTAEIKDARGLWGQGIRRTTYEISMQMGPEAVVAAIGPSGENMVPMSVIMNSVSHAAGGGAVLGAKNLKAIGVRGAGSIHIAGNKEEWEKAVKYHLSLFGANNQAVVPSTPQPWAEHYNPAARWVASAGRAWGAANPPIDVGSCDPGNLNRIAYRSNSAAVFLGEKAWQYTVRGNGCTGCPIRCHTLLKVPTVAPKYGISEFGQGTCTVLNFGKYFFRSFPDGLRGQTAIEASMVGMHLAEDLGIWSNYNQLQRDFQKCYYEGIFEGKIAQGEFQSYSWDKYVKGDPGFLFELLPRIARKEGELATALGLGTGSMLERWGIAEEDWKEDHKLQYWKLGHPKHHSCEDAGQCGVIINTQYNRDAQCHSHTNFIRNGLPLEIQKKLAADLWGSEDAVDAAGAFTPMNLYKAKMAKWAILRKELHDSISLCNWMGPWSASPLKERGYKGDDSIESLLYSLVTGDTKSRHEMDEMAERIFLLHRALTLRGIGTKEMRAEHDIIPPWVYGDDKDQPPFTRGEIRMDRDDLQKAMDMFYEEMGWDKKTGSPLRETFLRLRLPDVAGELGEKGLLP
jgi:aldehyde:ferredoxin oxidoreductase